MRIGIFTDAYEPHLSGVTTSINMLKKALEEMNHEVYIVTANLEKNRFKYNKKNRIIHIPGIKTGIYNFRLTNIYSKKAMKIIKDWDLDIIHNQTEFGIGTFATIVSKKLNIPIVHTYHTLYEDCVHYVTKGHFNNIAKKIIIKYTKHVCHKYDELIVPTNKIKDLFINKYNIKRKIYIIPTRIDTKNFIINDNIEKNIKNLKKKYKIKDNDFIIGAVGRVAKEKSFDKLINTMDTLLKINNNFKLLIVGDGPELNNLKMLVKKIKLEKNIIFTGKVEYELIPNYYNLFDIMTSFSTTETQGLTIIEALAASTPVICINDDSFKEMVQHNYNGYLFKNEEEFIKRVLELKINEKLYKEMCTNAKNSIHRFSKEVFASDILKVYYEALNKKNSKN